MGPVHVSVVSSDPSVATASYDSASQTVSFVGVSAGTATITASGEAEGPNFSVPFLQDIVVTVILAELSCTSFKAG